MVVLDSQTKASVEISEMLLYKFILQWNAIYVKQNRFKLVETHFVSADFLNDPKMHTVERKLQINAAWVSSLM